MNFLVEILNVRLVVKAEVFEVTV